MEGATRLPRRLEMSGVRRADCATTAISAATIPAGGHSETRHAPQGPGKDRPSASRAEPRAAGVPIAKPSTVLHVAASPPQHCWRTGTPNARLQPAKSLVQPGTGEGPQEGQIAQAGHASTVQIGDAARIVQMRPREFPHPTAVCLHGAVVYALATGRDRRGTFAP